MRILKVNNVNLRSKIILWLFLLLFLLFYQELNAASSTENMGNNLLKNGDFSEIDSNGVPKEWLVQFEGAEGSVPPKGNFSIVEGPNGKKAIKIKCTEAPFNVAEQWIIFMQLGAPRTKQGQKLYISFWVKKENIPEDYVNVAVRNLEPWSEIFDTTVPISEEWRKVETVATPVRGSNNTRFQIWFPSVNKDFTLYIADVKIMETNKDEIDFNPVRMKMEKEIAAPKEKNIIFNSGFEAGLSGWACEDIDYNIVKLDDTTAFEGKKSARIDFDHETLPVGYYDEPRPAKVVYQKVMFVTQDWLRLEKGANYTLSVQMKSNKPVQQALIGIFYMPGKKELKYVSVSSDWNRFELSFKAEDIFAFIGIVSETKDFSEKLWIDAVQLEKGGKATNYETRYPVEAALYSKRLGNVYYNNEDAAFRLETCRRDNGKADLNVKVMDYRGKLVSETTSPIPQDSSSQNIIIPIKKNGHYKLTANVKGGNFEYSFKQTFAIIYPYAEKYGKESSWLGMNHAYHFDLCQKLAKEAGLSWVRDWGLTWGMVEPRQGEFDFSKAEMIYNRLRSLDMNVQTCLGNPSSSWASSGPEDMRGKKLGDSYASEWYLPKDMNYFRSYVRKCMEVFGDRIKVWEVFNEPFKTQGWKTDEKYNDFLRIVNEEAKKANKDLKIMRTGLRYFQDEKASIQASKLSDILSEHIYPLYSDTREGLKRFLAIESFLKSNNLKNDIWITEFARYADDEPHFQYAGDSYILSNGEERVASAYSIKYFAIFLSHGASKILYHTRNHPSYLHYKNNNIHQDVLFKDGPTLHKFFVASNAFSWFLCPGTSHGVAVNEKGPIFAYSFKRKSDKVLMVWADKLDVKLSQSVLENVKNVSAYDMMGGKIDDLKSIGDEPVYLIGDNARIEKLEGLLRDYGQTEKK